MAAPAAFWGATKQHRNLESMGVCRVTILNTIAACSLFNSEQTAPANEQILTPAKLKRLVGSEPPQSGWEGAPCSLPITSPSAFSSYWPCGPGWSGFCQASALFSPILLRASNAASDAAETGRFLGYRCSPSLVDHLQFGAGVPLLGHVTGQSRHRNAAQNQPRDDGRIEGASEAPGRRLEPTHRHGRLMGGRFVRASGATRGANPISPRRGEDPGAQGLPPRGVIS